MNSLDVACTIRGPADAPPAGAASWPHLRAVLRQATAAKHAALDARFAGLVEHGDLRLYSAFLRMTAACRAVLDPLVLHAIPAYRASGPAALIDALARDIEAMRLVPQRPPRVQPIACGLPEAAGVLYVLDGSRLGARFLLPRLSRKFDGGVSLEYLKAAAAPHVMFRELESVADRVGAGELERTIDAARAAFDLFDRAARSALSRQA